MNGSASQTSPTLLGRLGRDPNDSRAWAEFVHSYGRKILEWCRARRLQDADAQEVMQEVLLQVAKRMKTFVYDPSRSFRAWLRKVTHDAWCDWLHAGRRFVPIEGTNQGEAILHDVSAREDLIRLMEEQFDAELLAEAIGRVRLQVAPKTWEAFRLTAFEQLPGATVAERLGMRVGAVFVAKSRVRKLLQEQLAALDPESLIPDSS